MKKLLPILAVLVIASCASPERPDNRVTRVFPLQHRDASEIAKLVAVDEKKQTGLSELAADARTNSIIALGSHESISRVEKRIRELDVP